MELVTRLLIVALFSSTLFAASPDQWIPVRWPGGPLELMLREKAGRQPASAELTGIIRDWYSPRTLELLGKTPINCLLVTWSAGADAAVEAAQQKLVAAYIPSARERGIAIVGLVYPGADPARAAGTAVEASLDGLALDGDFSRSPNFVRQMRDALRARNSSLPVIPLGPRDALLPDADWPILGASDGVTPRVRVFSESGGVAATPSSEPWIDSNLWLVRWLRAWSGPRPVWLAHLLENPAAADYERAIGEAAAASGRWVVAPDDRLRAGLWRREAAALGTWKRIADCLQFQEQHREWRAFTPVAALGIIQDRGGRNADVSAENLNLITRRRTPYRIIERAGLTAAALAGLPAVLATDLAPPDSRERELLDGYVRKGGLLVTGPSWNSSPAGEGDYAVKQLGAGQITVYKQDPPDPESLAKDLVDVVGNENLPVRLFHVASVLGQVTAAPGGSRLLVQLVNYATEPSDQITVRAVGEYRSARLISPGEPVADLKVARSGNRVDVRIPQIGMYAAVLFEN